MFARGRWAVAFGMALSIGCTPRQTPDRSPKEVVSVPGPASHYATDPLPGGAVGGNGIAQLQADVAAALAERGDNSHADGALSAAASWALKEVDEGRALDTIGGEAAARHFGFAGTTSGFIVFETREPAKWRDHLQRMPSNVRVTRYGIRVGPSGRWAGAVFGSVEASYEPIPRVLRIGQSVTLKGQIDSRFEFCHVFLAKPDGRVDEMQLTSRAFDLPFTFEAAGTYRLEVMGDGATGPVVLSNVPLFVGIPEPIPRGVAGMVVGTDAAEARLFSLLNEARQTARLNPLELDGELREHALAHSRDMAEGNFVSHVSPRHGTTEQRLRRWRIHASLLGENLSKAETPEVVHERLMSSPGHRANMLRPEFTHVGIGVSSRDSSLLATIVFGRRPSPEAMPTTAAQLESAIPALRAAKGLPVAKADPVYRVAAGAGADALSQGKDLISVTKAAEAALQREVDRRQTSRPPSCVLSLDMLELAQLEQIPGLFRASLRRFGVGTQVRRDEKGASLSTVLMLEDPEHCK